MKTAILTSLLTSLYISTSSLASEEERPKYKEPTLALGFASIYATSPYQGQEDPIRVVPSIFHKNDYFFIRNTSLGVEVYNDDKLRLELLGKYRFQAYEEDDSETLAGMDDRDGTLEAGIALRYKFDYASISLAAFSDVLNEHGGQELELKIQKSWRWRFLAIEPYVGLSFLSDDFTKYYYGVRDKEASLKRASYEPGHSLNWKAGISFRAGINENTLVFANFGLKFLDADIDNSPIVDQDSLFSTVIGISYSF